MTNYDKILKKVTRNHNFKYYFYTILILSSFFTYNHEIRAEENSPDPYVGSVMWTGGIYCPRGYVKANGQILSIQDYQSLYALIGPTFGGNGVSTFGLPNLQGQEVIGTGQGKGLSTDFAWGQKTNTTGTLQLPETLNPAHKHDLVTPLQVDSNVTIEAPGSSNKEATPENNYFAWISGNNAAYSHTYTHDVTPLLEVSDRTPDTVTTAPMSDQEQDQIPARGPQLAVTACICVEGLFPNRSQ